MQGDPPAFDVENQGECIVQQSSAKYFRKAQSSVVCLVEKEMLSYKLFVRRRLPELAQYRLTR
eukprot:scaffold4964_cov166-Amphora_coffeaeformis.AAC.5